MTQFYDDMLKAAEGIETGFEFYTKEIIPGTWEELPHGQKCTYGKWFAEDVRAGKVKGVVSQMIVNLIKGMSALK